MEILKRLAIKQKREADAKNQKPSPQCMAVLKQFELHETMGVSSLTPQHIVQAIDVLNYCAFKENDRYLHLHLHLNLHLRLHLHQMNVKQ